MQSLRPIDRVLCVRFSGGKCSRFAVVAILVAWAVICIKPVHAQQQENTTPGSSKNLSEQPSVVSDQAASAAKESSSPDSTDDIWATEFRPDQSVLPAPAPEGAVVLFDGMKNVRFLSKTGGKIDWPVKDESLVSTPKEKRSNHIVSTWHFGDADIHLEFLLPEKSSGNSGIYIHGLYELQILNSHLETKLAMKHMGAIYNFAAPLVQAAKPSGQWQVYDVRYRTPRRNEKGEITVKGSISAWLNGQRVQDRFAIGEPRSKFIPYRYKATKYLKQIEEKVLKTSVGPIFLQDHDSPVRFRNIWVRPLDDLSFDSTAAGSDAN